MLDSVRGLPTQTGPQDALRWRACGVSLTGLCRPVGPVSDVASGSSAGVVLFDSVARNRRHSSGEESAGARTELACVLDWWCGGGLSVM